MEDTKSEISESDLKLFKQLMNPGNISMSSKEQDEMFARIKKKPGCRIEVIESPKSSPKEEEEEEEQDEKKEEEEEGEEDEGEEEGETEEEEVPAEKEEESEFEYPKQDTKGIFAQKMKETSKKPSPKKHEDDYAINGDVDVETENRNVNYRREKQEILFLLKKNYPREFEKGDWSMKMPLFELKYDLTRRQEADTEAANLAMMKDALKFIVKGIEGANRKWGPLLELDGWSEDVTSDMSKFDRCLTAIYLKLFRKKTMNPFVELMFLIVGSAAYWHIRSKLGEDPKTKKQKEVFNKVHDIKPPPKAFDNPSGGMGGFGNILNLFGGMS